MEAIDISYAIGLKPKEAIQYFESKGRTISFAWQDVWQESHARAFTVAGMAKADLLADVQAHVSRAIKEGRTTKMFAADLIPVLQKKGWWGEVEVVNPKTGEVRKTKVTPARVALIHRQNVSSAYNAGRYKQQQSNAKAQPYWMYDAVLDQKTRPSHGALDGTIFPADDSFWDSHYPPNGWGCRCKVTALSERGFQKMGGKLTKSDGRMISREVEVKNSFTGEMEKRTVKGFKIDGTKGGREFFTDVGFSYNAGKSFLQGSVQNALTKLDSMPANIAKPAVKSMVHSAAFEQWYTSKDANKGFYPVATIPPKDIPVLNVKTSVARLSPQTVEKQLDRHPEVGLDDYKRIQDILDAATYTKKEGDTLIYMLDAEDGMVTVVKATVEKTELFIVSTWKLSRDKALRDKTIQRILKR